MAIGGMTRRKPTALASGDPADGLPTGIVPLSWTQREEMLAELGRGRTPRRPDDYSDLARWQETEYVQRLRADLARLEVQAAADELAAETARLDAEVAAADLDEIEVRWLTGEAPAEQLHQARERADAMQAAARTAEGKLEPGRRALERVRHLLAAAETEAKSQGKAAYQQAYLLAMRRMADALLVASAANAELDRIFDAALQQYGGMTPAGLVRHSWLDLDLTVAHPLENQALLQRWLVEAVSLGLLPSSYLEHLVDED